VKYKRSPARAKAIIAILLTKYPLTPRDVARMTDRQIIDLYWHRRNKDGEIEIPDPIPVESPPKVWTLEMELAQVGVLARMLRMPEADQEELREQLRVKYGAK
jgi:hypothetical protein